MASQQLDEKAIFNIARNIDSPDARAKYLKRVCGDDVTLLARVENLLRAYEQQGSFLESPAAGGDSPTISPSTDESPGMRIGPYKLLQQIGEGGMGTVFMAEQSEPIQRQVALKVIKPGMDSHQVVARFEAERQALAIMDHVNIARVFDGGTTPSGRPYFVMELVHGVPITQYCDDNHLTPRERLELFVPVCQAIQHAHQKGIIHRDIKPSNVMITFYDGKPVAKVIDFGVAKAIEQKLTERTLFTQYGTMVGTLEYMSPEQAEMSGLGIDTRSDIYSLGVILYELLTGSTPVTHKRIKEAAYAEILRLIKEEEPPRPSTRLSESGEALASISANRHTEPVRLTKLMRGELDWIVMKTLEKDRNRRYETALGFAADVQRYLNNEAVQACPPSTTYRFQKFVRRNTALLTTVGVVAVALLLGIIGTTWQAIHSSRQRDRAVAAETLAETRLQSEIAARRDAQKQEELAVEKSLEAARNLRQARQSVDDWFTTISQTTLLESPGLEPLREQLLESALTYYRELLEQSQQDPELRADVAAAQLRLAVIYISLDRADDALAATMQGLELVEQLIDERPEDTQFRRKLAGYFKFSRQLYQNSRRPSDPLLAVATLERSAEIWKRFVREDPATTGFQGDLAGMYMLLGEVHQVVDLEKGHAYFVQAREILEQLVRSQPAAAEYHDMLILAVDTEFDVLTARNQSAMAEETGRRSIRYFEQLVEQHPGDLNVRYSLARSQHMVATGLQRAQSDAPMELYRQELGVLETLVAESPTNPHFRRQLYSALDSLAALVRRDGRDAEAEELYRRSVSVSERLILDYPHVADYRQDFARSLIANANRVRDSKSELELRRAIAIQEQLAADFPSRGNILAQLAQGERTLALLLRDSGKTDELESLHRKIVARHQLLAERFPNTPSYDTQLARSLNQLGHTLRAIGKDHEGEAELLRAQRIWNAGGDEEIAKARQAAERDPGNGHLWHSLFIAHYNAGEWENCLWALGKKREVFRDPSSWDWFHEAMAHWQLDHRDIAIAKYNLAIAGMEHTGNHPVAQLRGYQTEAAVLLGLPDPGPRANEARGHAQHGASLEQQGDLTAAKASYGKAIDLYFSLAADFPHVPTYILRLVELLTKCDRKVELEKVYHIVATAPPPAADAPAELRLANANFCNDFAFALFASGRQTEADEFIREAIDRKRALAADYPDDPLYRFHLGHSYLGLATIVSSAGRESDAVDANRTATDLFTALARSEAGSSQFRQWNAHALWQASDAWLRLNRADEAEKSFEQARATFEQLAMENPAHLYFRQEQAFSHRRLADVAVHVGRKGDAQRHRRDALKIYQDLVARSPDSVFYRSEEAIVHLQLTEVLLQDNQTGAAQEAYKLAIESYDDLLAQFSGPDKRWVAGLLNGIAWPPMMVSQPPEEAVRLATAMAQRAVELEPMDGAIWSTLGMARYRAGDWKAAAEAFDKAAECGFNSGTKQLFAAMTQWQMGRPDLARTQLAAAGQWIDDQKTEMEGVSQLQKEAEELIGMAPKVSP